MDNPLGGGSGPDLFSKVGPLPAWAWGALAVGVYILWSHHTAPSPQAADNTVDGSADQTDLGNTSNTDGSLAYGDVNAGVGYTYPTDPSQGGYNYGDVISGDYGGTSDGTTFNSNQQWGIYVIGAEIKAGSPAAATTTAITYYLAGKQLTQDEAGIVNKAIGDFGPPPLPLPVLTITGTATPGSTTLGVPHLNGSQVANHAVSLSWQPTQNAVRYLIYRDGGLSTSTTGTTHTTPSMKKGTKHSFYVKAVGKTGKLSAASNTVTVTIK